MAQAPRDQNFVTGLLLDSSTNPGTTVRAVGDEATGRLLVDNAGGGSGTVTSVSVVTANGFAGSVATATTTPAITLTTTVTGILSGNGTAVSAASTTGSGAVVLANSPTFTDDITLGGAGTATGSAIFKGTTSGTVTLSVADAAGTWTMKLPTSAGTNGYSLTTDGSGNTTWTNVSGGGGTPGGLDTQIQYNNAGSFGGVTGATTNGTTITLTSARATTDFSPSSNDGATLGTTTLGFGDLHLATGGVINWANGEITLTETDANTLTFAGGIFALPASGFSINGTTVTSTGAQLNYLNAATGTTGTTSTNIVFSTSPTLVTPTLGVASATSINKVAITAPATSATLTLADGSSLVTSGANSITLTSTGATNVTLPTSGTLATTTYVPTTITVANEGTDTTCFPAFFTAATGDLGPKTNANLTYNSNTGAFGLGTSAAFTTGTIELGAASDTTLARVSAGVVSVEGVTVATSSNTLTFTNKSIGAGALTLEENASVALDPALSADGKYTGITITGTAGTTLAFGDLIYLAVADSRWELVDADSTTTCGAVLTGMCVLAAAADGDPTTILLHGNIRADAAFPALTVGAPVYASTTAGDIQVAQPSGVDDVIHVVGFALTADSIYFNPSPDYITHV